MSQSVRRVAILGSGASGLPAIKSCLEEGLVPVCFEKTDDIGGLWKFRESVEDGVACVMKSTITNTSKEFICYSDFPIPKEYPNFMHNTKLLQYFRLYADHFDLLKHIRFQSEVIKIKQADDFQQSGRWVLDIVDKKTKASSTETFDAVLLCTGHYACKYMAHFEGEERFKGLRMHTHEYRNQRGFEGKRVVVVGVGNSGVDIAAELGKFGCEVYLSTRRGTWVAQRVADNGLPIDYLFTRRFISDIMAMCPRCITNSIAEWKLNQRFDHAMYGLKPDHRFDAQHVSLNDELANRIASGSVIIKSNIRKLTERDVEFDDGSVVKNVDAIVYATGYQFGFPYMEHKGFEVKKNEVNLYKYVFPPDIIPSTIAVIGCFQPLGGVMPVSELQSRLAVRVFKKEVKLPSSKQMWADIERKREIMRNRFTESQRHTIQIDYVPFALELAELAGCKVNLKTLWMTDPYLAFKVYFGPNTPFEFRLEGPGSWSGAREAIMTTRERVEYPFKTRKVSTAESSAMFWIALVIFLFLCLFLLFLFL